MLNSYIPYIPITEKEYIEINLNNCCMEYSALDKEEKKGSKGAYIQGKLHGYGDIYWKYYAQD